MTRRMRFLAACGAGALLALGTLRMVLRMLDGGAPWPLAALVLALGSLFVVLVFRFRRRWERRTRPEGTR